MSTEQLADQLAKLPPEKRNLFEQKLREKTFGRDKSTRSTIRRRSPSDPSPLTFAQRRLWFLHQLEPNSRAYIIPQLYSFTGPLNIADLEAGLNYIIERHEALRSCFPSVGGEPIQQPSDQASVELHPIDLSGVEGQKREEELARICLEVAQQPFDLAHGPLLRFCLLRMADDEHRLLVVWHHMITDGWSMDLFERELAEFYSARRQGRDPALSELAIQYLDYAVWQQENLRDEALDAQRSYWKQKFGNLPELLSLPTDRPRPARRSHRGGRHNIILSEDIVERMEALGRRENATLFMVLMAAFQVLLHRLSGQTDICTGFPVAARNIKDTEDVIGLFADTLVLRSDLECSASFREILRQTRENVQDAMMHQDLPFEALIEEIRPERHLSHSPLFQVFFAYDTPREEMLSFHGLTTRREFFDIGAIMFDLSLFAQRTDNGLTLAYRYDSDLFDVDTITRWAEYFECLLESILADPDVTISRLDILAAAERAKILHHWNSTAALYPSDNCLHELIHAQMSKTPDRTAVFFDNQEFSYAVLEEESNRLAHHLHGLGVGPGSLVGICLERNEKMLFGLLAILKAGAAYVPIDPAFPRDRQTFMIEDAGISALLTEKDLCDHLPLAEITVVRLDSQASIIASAPQTALTGVFTTPDSLAYVIYTSGSTGRPKGVCVSHRAVVNFLCSMRECPGLTSDDRLFAVTTLSFDIAGLELYLPLISGACVIVASRAVATNGEELARQLSASGTTIMQATPATWRLLLETGWQGDRTLKVLCGGEAMPRDLADQLLGCCGELWNMYGPTETTVWSAVHPVASGSGPVPVGRPISNTDMYILDAHLEPVPIGVAGEVFIGGAGVAEGYWKRPELTAERFLPHPFSSEPESKLYRTGDLGRYLANGEIEIMGRLDHQVKLRGFRIELGEIEAALATHDEVLEAVVVLRGEDTDRSLVAYIVLHGNREPTQGELREHLKRQLPEYMVPANFVTLEALPQTPNGKIDRKALPDVGAMRIGSQQDFIAPQTPTEQTLAEIWSEVLGVEQVGHDDNFFELGGHSLLAVRLFALIEDRLGTRLPLATLFENATIGDLAKALADATPQASWSSLVGIQTSGSRPPLYCIHAEGGEVLFYRDFAMHLGENQPVYGLQARGLDGREPPDRSIEEMAAGYLSEIRSVQPEGPYYLAGHCDGSVIAFEMAQQLHAAGEKVGLLAMLDGAGPPVNRTFLDTITRVLKAFRRNPSGLAKYLVTTEIPTRWRRNKNRRSEQKLDQHGDRKISFENQVETAIAKVEAAIKAAYRSYEPKIYAGPIVCFINNERAKLEINRWADFTSSGVDLRVFPGTPQTSFQEPTVGYLAEGLRTYIDALAAASKSGES